jgi:hypothetical protein
MARAKQSNSRNNMKVLKNFKTTSNEEVSSRVAQFE